MYGTFQTETHAYYIRNKPMQITSETKTLELLKPKVHICNFCFSKFPVDCDGMMHVLKDSIIFK